MSDKAPSRISDDGAMSYYSKIDGAYFTREGMEKERFKFFLKRGIIEQLQNGQNEKGATVNIGFNPEEQKWYGWSHRAIHGFGVGAGCKKGDCSYHPANKNDFLENCVRFWDDKHHESTTGEFTDKGVQVSWKYDNTVKNIKLRDTIGGTFCEYPSEYGKGEWIAKTLKDAKKMAIDFAEGVS